MNRDCDQCKAQQQEPVAWILKPTMELLWPYEVDAKDPSKSKAYKPLYTSLPPSKPWVGLTEQERNDLEDYCEMIIGKAAFEAIEAKLREKNA